MFEEMYLRLLSGRLRNFKQKSPSLFNFSCPFCGDSKKNIYRSRGYIIKKSGKYFFKCHNCHSSKSYDKFLEELAPDLYSEYKFEKYFKGKDIIQPSKHSHPIPRFTSKKFDKLKLPGYNNWESCDKLPESNLVIKYLKSRKIPERCFSELFFTNNFKELIQEVCPGNKFLDKLKEESRLIIPVLSEYSELIGIIGRSLGGGVRYIKVPLNTSPIIFGMDKINLKGDIKIVEGPIDSLFLKNCLASCDANLEGILKYIPEHKDRVTLIFDNEPRNLEIVRKMENALKNNLKVCIWPDYLRKDINLMILQGYLEDQIEEIILENTFTGLSGLLKLKQWRRC